MARYSKSFQMTLEAKIDARVRAAYEALEGLAACAGIKNDSVAAKEARINHHGSLSRNIPARRFVTVSSDKTNLPEYNSTIKQIIKDNLKQPINREWDVKNVRTRTGNIEAKLIDVRQTQPFGTSTIGAKRLMNKVAKQMAENQRQVIEKRQLEPNKASTIKKKKGDQPLVDTGHLLGTIEHWVEEI